MLCPKCNAKKIKPIQESKDDYWLCSSCGDYHKGFPYKCPKGKTANMPNDIVVFCCEFCNHKSFPETANQKKGYHEVFCCDCGKVKKRYRYGVIEELIGNE